MAKHKPISGLDCSAPADKMVRLVLRTQLKRMCALRNRALDWEDPKGIHDMRVLSRRLRSAMSDLKPYLGKVALPQLQLKSIARSLGAVRDEDVALSALEELKIKANDQVSDGIEILAQEHCRRREEARAALERVISRSAVKEFRKEFLAKVSDIAIAGRSRPTNEKALSFDRLGLDVINARLEEFNKASRVIYLPFEIQEIHKLRILAKRLRYAIQLFAVCLGKEAEESAQEISLLQDSLGALHDCDVWIERLGARLGQTARAEQLDNDHERLRESAVWLLGHFARERAEHYGDALSRWRQWEVDGFLQKLKSGLSRGNSLSKAV
jgi:CHAD domain-containing protein